MNLSLCTLALSGALALILGAAAQAQVTPVAPFTGTESETWESFPNYTTNGGNALTEPVTIFGGAATMTSAHQDMYIYLSSLLYNNNAPFYLGTSGFAQASDGVQGMGLNSSDDSATIAFTNPVTAFGAFWGGVTGAGFPYPNMVTLDFFSASSTLIGTETFQYSHASTGDGGLDWHGYSFTTPIAFVTYSGDYVVTDGLQANGNASAVPEPGAYALLGSLGLSGVALLRSRRAR